MALMAATDRQVLAVAEDMKTELGEFRKKIDQSSKLTSDNYRRYCTMTCHHELRLSVDLMLNQ